MTAYYNENNPEAAAWLRELIKAGLIAPGHVDDRSIEDVQLADLDGFIQFHFFAGIGVWSYALRCAGWPDDRPVWTGSCPCQPFSQAGKGAAFDDPRHLWPTWFRLIRKCRPDTIFGEQVASKDGLAWIDLVHADLEGEGYAVGAVDSCAAGFGAPHIRQRMYWVANSAGSGWGEEQQDAGRRDAGNGAGQAGVSSGGINPRWMADSNGDGRGERQRDDQATRYRHTIAATCGDDRHKHRGPTHGHWRDADWLLCRDGKWRPVEPGTFPLAHGAPARVGRLRGYGNAIVAPQAEAFVRAYMGIIGIPTRRDLLAGGAV